MEFTKQEINLLKRITSTGKYEQWIWETVYLVPSIALIAFGALEGSKGSIFVGTGVLATIRIMVAFQQSKRFEVFKGLCTKMYDQDESVYKPNADTTRAE